MGWAAQPLLAVDCGAENEVQSLRVHCRYSLLGRVPEQGFSLQLVLALSVALW